MPLADRLFSRAGLIAAWVLLVLAPLPIRELMTPDESRFAHQAQTMKETGDSVVPYIGDNISVDKPPVLFWGILLASLPLDRVTETTSRLPSAIAALVVLLLTARLGRRLWGSDAIGWGGALVALTGIEFLQKAEWCSCDMPMAAFAWTAITLWREALFGEAQSGDPPPARPALWIALGWAAVGLGVLTKGPVALLWAVFWVLAEAIARRRFRPLLPLLWSPGILIAVAIVGGWLFALGQRAGWNLVYEVTIHQNLDRYASAWNSVAPWWFYSYQTPVDLLPWTGFLPAAIYLVLKRRSSHADDRSAIAARAAGLCILFGILFFSGSSGKRGVYLMPVFPAFSLLVAGAIVRGGARVLGFGMLAVVGLLIGVAAPIAIALGAVKVPADVAAAAGWIGPVAIVAVGLALATGAVIALLQARRGSGPDALASAVAGTVVAMFLAVTVGGAVWSRMQGAQPFGAAISAAVPKDARLAVERNKFEQILFYARRTGREFESDAEFARAMTAGQCDYAVMWRTRYDKMRAEPPADAPPALAGLTVLVEGRINKNDYVLIGPPSP